MTAIQDPEAPQYEGAGLRLEDVSVEYGSLRVVHGVSMEIPAGSTTCIIGPSGSGKSTLLRSINRLHPPATGEIYLADEPTSALNAERLRTRLGMVFQHFNLFPDHTALENVMLAPRKVLRLGESEAKSRAERLLHEVGLGSRMDHRPRDLSGGQQQRVAIARALAMEPSAVLFDEVTSALDPELVKGVLDLMTRLGRTGMTMVVVTHEMGFARRAADQVVFMDEGRVVESGSPAELFDRPRSQRLRTFLDQVL